MQEQKVSFSLAPNFHVILKVIKKFEKKITAAARC